MRLILIALPLMAACSSGANHIGNPLLLPISGISTAIENTAYQQRRGAVELLVKTNHDAILSDIHNGGGPILSDAMMAARIPPADRAARILQLRGDVGLYQNNPGALVVALMVYGG